MPDGASASIVGVLVRDVNPDGSFTVREGWSDAFTLSVIPAEPVAISPLQTVDVSGTILIVNGKRQLNASSVRVYTDSAGSTISTPLPVRTAGGSLLPWQWRDDAQPAATVAPSGMMSSMNSPPPPGSQGQGQGTSPAPGSRDSLKWLPDGAHVSINGIVVSASFTANGYFYVEKSDRSFGIKIVSTEYVAEGQLVDVTGVLGTVGGERVIIANTGGVNIVDYNTYPTPGEVAIRNYYLGGGAVGPYTPAVGDAQGLNNTGLRVGIGGKVTYADYGTSVFYVSDGSNVVADEGRSGVKVYDYSYGLLPDVDADIVVYGVAAAEIPSGSTTSIRVLHKTEPSVSALLPGSGSITGTITATGANGKTVRVFSGNRSTTATFSGSIANYTLPVSYGNHAVTASLAGYKTTTQLASVNSATPVSLDFTIPALQTVINVSPSPSRIPPDGVSQATITAIVRDEEGRRIGNAPVSWNVDLGTVVSSDATTDAIGEARLVLQSPSAPGTANISVSSGGATANDYVEFASPTAPVVRLVTPINNENVTGVLTIRVEASDPGGTKTGVQQIGIYVDNQQLSSIATTNPTTAWASYTLSNGVRQLRAIAIDGDLEYGYSPAVTVTAYNGIHNVTIENGMFDANDTNPAKRNVTFMASQDDPLDWELEIKKRGTNSPTKVFTGTGTTISATWDGTDSQGNPAVPGQYGYTIRTGDSEGLSTQSYVHTLWGLISFLRTDVLKPTALLVEGSHFSNNHELLAIVEEACDARNFQVITIPEKYATWERFVYFMTEFEPVVLYIVAHGDYSIRYGGNCLPAALPQVSAFQLNDAWVYAYRPTDNQGNWVPEYPPPGQPIYYSTNPPAYEAHYLSELGYTFYSPLRLVWMDTCLNGRIGGMYGDLSSQYNPYNVDLTSPNDLASMFGIYNNANTIGASLCGFFEVSYAEDRYRDFLGRVFASLKLGYSLDQAITRDAWNERPIHTGLYSFGIDTQYGPSKPNFPAWTWAGYNPCNNWRVPMPPYHNLRVYGNPWATTLSP